MSVRPSFRALRSAALVSIGVLAVVRPAAAETGFVATALAQGDFKDFVSLVSRADLADTLGAGPVTVFMPTDTAFARLTAAQRKMIADLSPEGVRDFVQRFVFPGMAMASNDLDQTITAQSGASYDVTWYKGRLSLRDHLGPAKSRLAYVVGGDIPAGAGVIDAIDTVLMPAANGTPGQAAGLPTRAGSGTAPAMPSDGGAKPVAGLSLPTTEKAPAPSARATATTVAEPADVTTVVVKPQIPVASAPAQPTAPLPLGASSGEVAVMTTPVSPPAAPALFPKPKIDVATAGLHGWPLKVSGNGSTGRVDSIIVGLPGGRVTGLRAHFGGFLGFGGRTVFVPWDRVTPDTMAHVLRARMTKAEFAAAPASAPKP